MAIENDNPARAVSPAKLWFGTITAAVSWTLLVCIDILINWRACQHQERYGIPPHDIGPRILIGCLAVFLLAIVMIAGVVSYRNWKRLSPEPELMRAHAVERREYMAVVGLIMTVTLGMGIVWLALPPLFLNICWRAR
jgi:H+/Cl- antiporter ClcA